MKFNRPTIILASVGMLLLIPLVAMQFSSEVDWNVFDFIVAAILLGALGVGIELALRVIKHPKIRLLWIAVIVLVFLLFWIELAVGVFGSPFAGD